MSDAGSLNNMQLEGMAQRGDNAEALWKGIWQRTNEAGIRLVMTEISIAESLLSRSETTRDARQRAECLKEAGAALEFASRFVRNVDFPDGEEKEVANRIEELRRRAGVRG